VETAELWPSLRLASRWVKQATHIPNNKDSHSAGQVKASFRGLIASMARHGHQAGPLEEALQHFLKVTRSYWPGLFLTYSVEGLPRTNNDLESMFGSVKRLDRRITGRKQSSPSLVLRGSVHLIAGLASRIQPLDHKQLRPRHLTEWHQLRSSLDQGRNLRRQQARFRRNPHAFLLHLEDSYLKLTLPE